VLCAGAWSRDLALTAGISLPVEPVRRQLVWSRCRQPIPGDLPMVIELGNGFHFRPAREFGSKRPAVGDARDVLMAFPDPYEPSSFATDFDTSFVQKVLDLARHRAPFLCDSDVVLDKCRAGLYENTPDRHPILGGCEIDGLFLACGFSGHGVMHSPAAGRAVTEIMLDGQSKFLDVACLSYDRFSRGELIEGTSLI
jgi:sarcosine oxidase subunit beta